MRTKVAILRFLLVASIAALLPIPLLRAQTPTPAAPLSPLAPPMSASLPADVFDAWLDAQTDAVMANMAVEDKVGQLFVVNFEGVDAGFESDIALLIHGYRIGGVVLSPSYHNFSNQKGAETPVQVATLANQLQGLAYGLLLPSDGALGQGGEAPPEVRTLAAEAARAPLNLPLLVGVEQMGDDLNVTTLRRGFTALPNQMTLGATWNPELTQQVGEIVGRELSAVGVNLLLGPSLDVLSQPQQDGVGALGVHSFGGDPFWTAEMGRAYIDGIHAGSEGRLATLARHFPGQGGADRKPNEEVPTIQASADELRRTALPPFVAVTGEDGPTTTDGLLPSNTRYTGLQRATSGQAPPLSLSPDLELTLQQEGLDAWRRHGVLMTNALGGPAVRRYYDPTLGEFPYRRIAADALGAGNDLLYLGQYTSDGTWESERVNIEATISFFQERYKSDPEFAARVDAAVRRILRLKLRLYAEQESIAQALAAADPAVPITTTLAELGAPALPIPLEQVLVTEDDLADLQPESLAMSAAAATVREVARESITLLHPDSTAEPLPPPQADDTLLIFTDSRLLQECADCVAETAVGPDDLADIMLQLYGPEATGQLQPEQVVSLTFADLAELLDSGGEAAAASTSLPTPTPDIDVSANGTTMAAVDEQGDSEALSEGEILDKNAKLDSLIAQADWLLFAMLDVNADEHPSSDVVKRFLRQRSEQVVGKNVVVLALNAPYFLDATEISKLSSYLGVYSKAQPFLETAVRTLFRALTPASAPPVSVAGTRFSTLSERLTPDPMQMIPLNVLADDETIAANITPAASDLQPTLGPGQTLRLEAGPLLDLNGHPVPDGTRVDFQAIYEGEELALTVEPALTASGMAVRELALERGGKLRLTASSGAATSGAPIAVDVAPLAAPLEGAVPASAPAGAQEIASTSLVDPSGEAEAAARAANPIVGRRANLVTLFVAMFTMLVMLSLLLIVQIRVLPRAVLAHHMTWAIVAGLIAYILYGVGLIPGADWLYARLDVWAPAVTVFLGMLLPLLWLQLRADGGQNL